MAKNNVSSMPQRPEGIGNRVIVRDFLKDYIVTTGYSPGQQRVLMGTTDELEREVDHRTYDLMENDATIIKCKSILITGVLSDEMQLAPGAAEEEVGPDEYDVYEKIMGFCKRCVDGFDRPYREELGQLLGNAIKYGHGIAEVEWDYRLDGDSTEAPEPDEAAPKALSMWKRFGYFMSGPFQPAPFETPLTPVPKSKLKRPILDSEQTRLMPTSVKVKPRDNTHFVVDNYMNILGIMPRFVNGTNLQWNEIVDRDKFLILIMNKQDEDPRGKSAYRAAFNWYNIKTQLPSEVLRLVLEEIVPKAVAVLSEDAQPFEIKRDENGNTIWVDPDTKQIPEMVTAAESLKFILEHFRSGSGAVVPFGTLLAPFKRHGASGAEADLVCKIIKMLDDQMEFAILHQTLAQSEGEHQARSASQQVAEILYNLIFWVKWQIAMMTLTDLFTVAVKMNYGDWAVKYLPKISLGDFVRRDWGDDLAKLSDGYFKGFIDDSQRPELMNWMGLPKPGQSRAEAVSEQVGAQPDVNGNPISPNPIRPDKQPGNTDRNKGNGTEKKKNVKQSTDEIFGSGVGNPLGHYTRGPRFISRYLFSGRK